MADNPRPRHDFNYLTWTPDTVLTLANVTWDNNYRDVVKFDNAAALDAYIDRRSDTKGRIDNASYARLDAPVRIDVPFNQALEYNYLRAHNPAQPVFNGDKARTFYYFVTGVRYIAPNTTEIIVQLDIFQSFIDRVTFGNCFIERGHVGIAASNAFNGYGRDFLSEPEGMDTGAEYRNVLVKRNTVMNVNSGLGASHMDTPSTLVLSTVDLTGDDRDEFGTIDDPNTPIATPDRIGGVSAGMQAIFLDGIGGFASLMGHLRQKPWIVAGIYSVSMVPNFRRYHDIDSTGTILPPSNQGGSEVTYHKVKTSNADAIKQRTVKMDANWRTRDGGIRDYIPARYRHLLKLLTFPYLMIEGTTWNGSSLIIRPEMWNDPDATIMEMASLLPPQQRITFIPRNYNSYTRDFVWPGTNDDNGDYLDFSISIDSFINVPVMNDAGALSLAQNAHGQRFQEQSAEWSQVRANAGIGTSYDQSTAAANLQTGLTDLSTQQSSGITRMENQQNMQRAIDNGIQGIATGAANGSMAGPVGALTGAGSAAIAIPFALDAARREAGYATRMTNVNNAFATAGTGMQTSNALYNRDTNQQLAQFSARGDYSMSMAAVQAKIQDTKTTAPSVAGAIGGDVMRAMNGVSEFVLRWKLLDQAAMVRIGEYWLRYGYAINRFGRLPASLMVMSKFTFWKLSETFVSGNMPEAYKQGIRGIFEKGVTVWKNPDDIGMIDRADNQPLAGVAL